VVPNLSATLGSTRTVERGGTPKPTMGGRLTAMVEAYVSLAGCSDEQRRRFEARLAERAGAGPCAATRCEPALLGHAAPYVVEPGGRRRAPFASRKSS
jgi:hypothetical protein